MKKHEAIRFVSEAVNTVIKNSEVIQPYVHPKDYRNGLFVLNLLHWGLKLWERREQDK